MRDGLSRRNRSGSKPPPRMTMGTLLILNARTPFGAMLDAPVRYDVTVRMPNCSLVELSTVPFCATEVASVYSGCAPSWYGHHSCGFAMVRPGNAAGVNDTVCVVFAGTVTLWLTVTAVPVGGVTVADTVPVCALADVFVTSVFTVRAELVGVV